MPEQRGDLADLRDSRRKIGDDIDGTTRKPSARSMRCVSERSHGADQHEVGLERDGRFRLPAEPAEARALSATADSVGSAA